MVCYCRWSFDDTQVLKTLDENIKLQLAMVCIRSRNCSSQQSLWCVYIQPTRVRNVFWNRCAINMANGNRTATCQSSRYKIITKYRIKWKFVVELTGFVCNSAKTFHKEYIFLFSWSLWMNRPKYGKEITKYTGNFTQFVVFAVSVRVCA